jgi:hypothetical protein
MSDRIDFYEIRVGDEDDWDSVCLVKEEEDAKSLLTILKLHYDKPLFIFHTEFVAHTNIEEGDY